MSRGVGSPGGTGMVRFVGGLRSKREVEEGTTQRNTVSGVYNTYTDE